MYGLINKAVKDLITKNHGEDTWIKISEKAGVPPVFISMHKYDDADTYNLVAATSEVLGVTASEAMRLVGNYWIRFTASEGYGHLLTMLGSTLAEFLGNLNNDLHGRVAMTMPELAPPDFDTEEVEPNVFEVHYKSHRAGLAPLVHGLLEGLADRFDTPADIAHKETLSESPAHEVFRVTIL